MKIQAVPISSGPEVEGEIKFFNPKFKVNNYKNKIAVLENLNKRRKTYKLRHAKAVISEKGGITSHGSIILRELGIPGFVLPNAKKILKNRMLVKINTEGEIETNIEGSIKIRPHKQFKPYKREKWLLIRPRTYCPLRIDFIREGIKRFPKIIWNKNLLANFKQTKKGYWAKNYPTPEEMVKKILENPYWFSKKILERKKIFIKIKNFIKRTDKKIKKRLKPKEYLKILSETKKLLTEVRPYTDLTQLSIDQIEEELYNILSKYFPTDVLVKYFDRLTVSSYTKKLLKERGRFPSRVHNFLLPAPKLEKFIYLNLNYNKEIKPTEEEKLYLKKIPYKTRKKTQKGLKILPLLTEISEETTYNIIILMNRANYIIEQLAKILVKEKKLKKEKDILNLTLDQIINLIENDKKQKSGYPSRKKSR